MLIRQRKGWEVSENDVTPESAWRCARRERRAEGFSRRSFVTGSGAAIGGAVGGAITGIVGAGPGAVLTAGQALAATYPGPRNPTYTVDRELTTEEEATTYNNFYEFGSHKYISESAQALVTDPWTIKIDGLVEEETDLDFADLLTRVDIEERVYRHRCVEAWAMTVPWSGFPLRRLVEIARPKPEAKYLVFKTLNDQASMPGLRQTWWPWPYTEGVTVAEAMNDLAFIATGIYGKALPKQNGAPIRLVLPWKYGFKSIKSIVRVSFTDKQPRTFWELSQVSEYGFYANVNPDVSHPRWSQATERLLGSGNRVPTRIYNGYESFVASLYTGMEETLGDRLFR